MIKRIIKLIGFVPMLIISGIFFPIALIIWLFTGVMPYPPIKNLIEW